VFRFFFLLTLFWPAVSLAVEPWPWTLQPVADGVYAALQPARWEFWESNSVVVITGQGVVVIDTQTDGTAVRTLIDEIRELTDQPVRYVINTHWHMDHTLGNDLYRQAFGDEVVFLGHASLMEDIPHRMAPSVAERVSQMDDELPAYHEVLSTGTKQDGTTLSDEERARYQNAVDRAEIWLEDYRDPHIVLPTITYHDRLTLHLGDHELQLLYRRGHTRGDTVVWLPRQKVLASGDLVDAMPYAGHGFPGDWAASLSSLDALDFDTVVPGHGPLLNRAQVELEQEFFAWLSDAAARFDTAEAAAVELDVSAWRERLVGEDAAKQRFFDNTIAEGIERAWQEAHGELATELN
jgi:glyoxylase-like metal-dependent hydrolase (beta-lactamase superfamily II)